LVQATERLEATIANPPLSLYSFWVNEQKGVGQPAQSRLTGYRRVEKTLQELKQKAEEARHRGRFSEKLGEPS
jgi:hypothetical protein